MGADKRSHVCSTIGAKEAITMAQEVVRNLDVTDKEQNVATVPTMGHTAATSKCTDVPDTAATAQCHWSVADTGLVVGILLVAGSVLLIGGTVGDWFEAGSSTQAASVPHDCQAADPGTLASEWDTGSCMTGASQGLWSTMLNGSTPAGPHDSSMCNGSTVGKLTCENRQSAWSADNIVLTPATDSSPSGKLVVFLPGTGGAPAEYSGLLDACAEAGNHVIGLTYLSEPVAVSQFNAWCQAQGDPLACNKELHERMLFGREVDETGSAVVSPSLSGAAGNLWDVKPENSVVALLLQLLQQQSWGTSFLSSDQLNWTNIVISGHSQGAGHAAYLGYKLDMPVVLFSGPQDCYECSDGWINQMNASKTLVRVLFHLHEECGPDPITPQSYCQPNLMLRNLELLGLTNYYNWTANKTLTLPASSFIVLDTVAPTCSSSRTYHMSVAMDNCAPFYAGCSALWRQIFTF